MLYNDDIAKKEIFNKIETAMRQKLETEKLSLPEKELQSFIHDFYLTVSAEDLSKHERQNLFGAAYSMFTFAQQRSAHEIKINIYNPTEEKDGWTSENTVVDIVMDDIPFLVDSILMEFSRINISTPMSTYPILYVQRDSNGNAQSLYAEEGANNSIAETLMHFEIDRISEKRIAELKENLMHILTSTTRAVGDWKNMTQKISEIKENLPQAPQDQDDLYQESANFLQWLHDGNFTFLGYRYVSYQEKGGKKKLLNDEKSSLGILKDNTFNVFDTKQNDEELHDHIVKSMENEPWLVRIVKSSHRATIHRNAFMDTVAVKDFDKKGKIVGEHLFLGLFTATAYNQSIFSIPLLKRRIQTVINAIELDKASHHYKTLLYVLETFPRDEIFQMTVDMIQDIAFGITRMMDHTSLDVFVRPDYFKRYASVFVYVPRRSYSSQVEKNIAKILEKNLSGSVVASNSNGDATGEHLIRIQYVVLFDHGLPDYDIRAIRHAIADISEAWEDKVKHALTKTYGSEQALEYLARYGQAFSTSYQARQNSQHLSVDIQKLEEIRGKSDTINAHLYATPQEGFLGMRVYFHGMEDKIIPSDIIPIIENMGLRVIEERPYTIRFSDDEQAYIHDFFLEVAGKHAVSIADVENIFCDTFINVWKGQAENDEYNRLITLCAMSYQDIAIVRTLSKYLGQIRLPFSQQYMAKNVTQNFDIIANVVSYFKTRFNPDIADRGEKAQNIYNTVIEQLDRIQNLDEDRILRSFLSAANAVLRTTFFQKTAEGQAKSYLAIKVDSHQVMDIPKPTPYREIFVYSPDFEAIHLRFAPVSRGGLRWSDRPEDFRTEILGLVKAQQVKNSVIVPMGSKGGFVLKRVLEDKSREALQAEGVRCYKLFMQSLLDLTDNIVDGSVVPPKNVVRLDKDDPYLVVAADKGTATFSDYANGISIENGFWFGDAFASGGSAGYDHKKMGITAKGAIECVARHFYQRDHDIFNEEFTVVGVGDMSGDVFGNGMLLSKHIRLLAAFNHMHIFIDPNPDAAKTFAERKRLFDMGRSTWKDYNEKLISQGGGIFERSAKSIPISPEMKEVFDIEEDALTPNQLIQHLLRARTDLLWFGGIGTYVKHSLESHADASDHGNNPVRVNAKELRCAVIGEGANLGMTQRARIEFAEKGGYCYTDAIDNSAGVDCSDHEVNIKLLLNPLQQSGRITEKERNEILEDMTDEVSELVLMDNRQQAQALAVLHHYAVQDLDKQHSFMRHLERHDLLDRTVEFLPSDDDIADRAQKQKGLYRPEQAVLLAYAKNTVYKDLLETTLPDAPILQDHLLHYFPTRLQKDFKEEILKHRLRREIIATGVTNSMINRTGPGFVEGLQEKTGKSSEEIVKAYLIVQDVFELQDLFTQIESLVHKITASAQITLLYEIKRTIMRITEWFLLNEASPLNLEENIKKYKQGVQELRQNHATFLASEALADFEKRLKRFTHPGVPEDLALKINQLKMLSMSCDMVKLASTKQAHGMLDVATLYSRIGVRFQFDPLRSRASRVSGDTKWVRRCINNVIEGLWRMQYDLTASVLEQDGDRKLETWIEKHQDAVDRMDGFFLEIQHIETYDIALLIVLEQELRQMIAS